MGMCATKYSESLNRVFLFFFVETSNVRSVHSFLLAKYSQCRCSRRRQTTPPNSTGSARCEHNDSLSHPTSTHRMCLHTLVRYFSFFRIRLFCTNRLDCKIHDSHLPWNTWDCPFPALQRCVSSSTSPSWKSCTRTPYLMRIIPSDTDTLHEMLARSCYVVAAYCPATNIPILHHPNTLYDHRLGKCRICSECILYRTLFTKNCLSVHDGQSPDVWTLGRVPKLSCALVIWCVLV